MIDKDEILGLWNKLDNKYKIIIISLICLTLLWNYMSSKLEKLKTKKQQVKGVKARIEKQRQKLSSIKKEIKELLSYEKELKRVNNKLKEVKAEVGLIEREVELINALTYREDRIKYDSINVLEEETTIKKEVINYKILPMEIKITTSFYMLGEYLKYIENSKYIVSTEEVKVKKKQDSFRNVEVYLKLNGYVAP